MEPLNVRASRRYGTLSPLRYPGGKAALAGLFEDAISRLGLSGAHYVEPYAGGAGAAIALLRNGIVSSITINDFDPAVHSFWRFCVTEPEEFIKRIERAPLNIDEWLHQRDIYRLGGQADPKDLGFAFFYLNRTNRSGVLAGGVIGGLNQDGNYKIDARFNKASLIARISAIAELAARITVSDLDGRTVIRKHSSDQNSFMYIDPPYVKAGGRLYMNSFSARDHEALARTVQDIERAHWILTYDTAPLIEKLYQRQFQRRYSINYSSHRPGQAEELMIASRSLENLLSPQARAIQSRIEGGEVIPEMLGAPRRA